MPRARGARVGHVLISADYSQIELRVLAHLSRDEALLEAFTRGDDIGVTQQAAQAFIDAYFAGFPAVRTFIDDLLATARDTGVVKTMFGRRRLVPDLRSKNGQIRAAAEREAVNMPIQSTAADILKRAMIDVHAALVTELGGRVRMILTVHDELLFEAPTEMAEDAAARVRALMEGAVTLDVPLTVDVGIGENWKEAKSYPGSRLT